MFPYIVSVGNAFYWVLLWFRSWALFPLTHLSSHSEVQTCEFCSRYKIQIACTQWKDVQRFNSELRATWHFLGQESGSEDVQRDDANFHRSRLWLLQHKTWHIRKREKIIIKKNVVSQIGRLVNWYIKRFSFSPAANNSCRAGLKKLFEMMYFVFDSYIEGKLRFWCNLNFLIYKVCHTNGGRQRCHLWPHASVTSVFRSH